MNGSTELRIKLVELLGGKCKHCGFSDIRALQIDHVDGGGIIESKTLGSYKMYKQYLDKPESRSAIQVLCANCNWIKKHENNENAGTATRKTYPSGLITLITPADQTTDSTERLYNESIIGVGSEILNIKYKIYKNEEIPSWLQ